MNSESDLIFSNLSPVIHVRFNEEFLRGPFDKVGYIDDTKDQIRVLLDEIGVKEVGYVDIHYLADDDKERAVKRRHDEFRVIYYDEPDPSVRYNF